MPTNLLIPMGQTTVVQILTEDATGAFRQALSLTATISDTANAFVAKIVPDNSGLPYMAVKNRGNLPPSATPTTVTVTLNGKALSGASLPAVSISFDLEAPAPPPDATQIVPQPPGAPQASWNPTDPGSATAILV